ncbi:MAG TPA: ATP-binding protein [Candidatus Saccharimonadales bacterium]|jgi:predicted kinase|nr:ATP-binding protein [Candidatus Saccharimonadales bacterium]
MNKPTLFLMLGYPGAGKTTASRIIHKLTGAEHLWADRERKKMFTDPAYTHAENLELYDQLNKDTAALLGAGKSVIFDTNFNFYKDRERLRDIGGQHGAHTVVVWVTVPKDIARERATKDAHMQDTRVLGDMPVEHFERMSSNLQEPRNSEDFIHLDGTRIDMPTVAHAIEQHAKTHQA